MCCGEWEVRVGARVCNFVVGDDGVRRCFVAISFWAQQVLIHAVLVSTPVLLWNHNAKSCRGENIVGCGVNCRLDDDVNGCVILGVEREDKDKEVSGETKVSFCSPFLVRPGVKWVYRVVILMPFSVFEVSGKQRGR